MWHRLKPGSADPSGNSAWRSPDTEPYDGTIGFHEDGDYAPSN
jgi:hypothetical protein